MNRLQATTAVLTRHQVMEVTGGAVCTCGWPRTGRATTVAEVIKHQATSVERTRPVWAPLIRERFGQ